MGRKRRVRVRKRRSLREKLRTWSSRVRFGLLVAGSAAVVLSGGIGARRYCLQNSRLMVPVGWVRVSGLPPYLDPQSRKALSTPPGDLIPPVVNLLDRQVLQRLAVYYGTHEWVAAVERFEYVFPGGDGQAGISGSLRLVEPCCVVAWEPAQTYYFTDSGYRRLGGPLNEPPESSFRIPVVYLARKLPLPARGGRWTEEAVRQGVDIARLLRENDLTTRYEHWIAWIDVRDVGRWDRSEVTLITENRVTLHWGRTPGSERSGRVRWVPAPVKIARLRRILSGEVVVPGEVEVNLFEALGDQLRETGWHTKAGPQ